jgi:hypothetical protein
MGVQKELDNDDGVLVDVLSGDRTIAEESYRLPVIIDHEDKEPHRPSAA